VANSLPAINDITAAELRSVVAKAADLDHTIRAARDAAISAQAANHGRVPPYRGACAGGQGSAAAASWCKAGQGRAGWVQLQGCSSGGYWEVHLVRLVF
jgi:hypothetical protein